MRLQQAQVEALSKKIDGLSLLKSITVMACDTCGGGHTSIDWQIVGVAHEAIEEIDFFGSAL